VLYCCVNAEYCCTASASSARNRWPLIDRLINDDKERVTAKGDDVLLVMVMMMMVMMMVMMMMIVMMMVMMMMMDWWWW